MMAEVYDEGGSHFMLVFDISKAHRRVPVLEEEWGRQACQVKGSAATTSQMRRAKSTEGTRDSRADATGRDGFSETLSGIRNVQAGRTPHSGDRTSLRRN